MYHPTRERSGRERISEREREREKSDGDQKQSARYRGDWVPGKEAGEGKFRSGP